MIEFLQNNCSESDKKCLKPVTKEKFTLKDSPSPSVTITNNKETAVYQIKLDGCLLEKNTLQKRCDWILYCKDIKTTTLFIELKSTDIKEAAEQLITSIDYIQKPKAENPICILFHQNKRNLPSFEKELKKKNIIYKTRKVSPKNYSIDLEELLA